MTEPQENKRQLPTLRLSVRGLVAFSHGPSDILPLSSNLMEEGRLSHLARQGQTQGQSEVFLSFEGEEEGRPFLVSGRCDLLDVTASPPLIEEIKRCPDRVPESPLPAHFLQAVVYGFLLAQKEGLPEVALRLVYAGLTGEVLASFSETWAYEKLKEAFMALLAPCLTWHLRLQGLRERRDDSLTALPFAYEAFRPGQREMAAQVYTAIKLRKRLFAVMPTGTGKSAAVLYPALKALGEGLTGQVFCLTARGTQALSMQKETKALQALGGAFFAVRLCAKEKLCPKERMRCHPDFCDRARGHYDRQQEALENAFSTFDWDEDFVRGLAARFCLCPFEFSLALCELADVVICDYNYALDPQVRLSRIFDGPARVSLLLDEAHNLPDRAREMLSGRLSVSALIAFRRDTGKALGRSSAPYKALTQLIAAFQLEKEEQALPTIEQAASQVLSVIAQVDLKEAAAFTRDLISFLSALGRATTETADYALLYTPGKSKGQLTALNLNPAPYLLQVTKRMRGCVYYSATLEPLPAMRSLLGGEEGDACLSLPSPFPEEHLLRLLLPINTRYRAREDSLRPAAQAIAALFSARPGKQIAFFPSFAYLQKVKEALIELNPQLPLLTQTAGMDEEQRTAFLAAFTQDPAPVLGLCVLGGVFSEGVDLPGEQLTALSVVGLGLPQVNPERERFRARMQETLGSGFSHAYLYPGLHKVLQAAGRLIRKESDVGVLLFLDNRLLEKRVQALLPLHLLPKRVYDSGEIESLARAFFAAVAREGET